MPISKQRINSERSPKPQGSQAGASPSPSRSPRHISSSKVTASKHSPTGGPGLEVVICRCRRCWKHSHAGLCRGSTQCLPPNPANYPTRSAPDEGPAARCWSCAVPAAGQLRWLTQQSELVETRPVHHASTNQPRSPKQAWTTRGPVTPTPGPPSGSGRKLSDSAESPMLFTARSPPRNWRLNTLGHTTSPLQSGAPTARPSAWWSAS